MRWSLCTLSVAALVAGLLATSVDAAEPVACGNRVYDKEAIFSFKPGSVLTYTGYLRLNVAIPVPGGRLTGFHYNGTCSAR